MASNNYAEVITDSTEAQQVVAKFESMAEQGYSFKVLQFNPELDRFNDSCWRESNYPTLLDVEASGTTMDGATVVVLWKSNARTVQAIDFGNTYFGLYYESLDRSYIAIRDADPVASQPQQAVENGAISHNQSID
jgi:hypothetical protein